MQPSIRYAQTKDGLNVAFYTIGQGPPLLLAWGYPSHVQMEWHLPDARSAIERAAERYSVIRYDPRGCGSSDRDVTDFSLDAMVQDIEAVFNRLHVGKAAVVARMELGPPAIAFASRHPEQVSRLVLVDSFAKGADFWTEQLEAFVQAAQRDWEFATEGMSSAITEWSQPELARALAAFLRASIDAHAFVSTLEQLKEWDVGELLPSLPMPTLVVYQNHRYVGVDIARKLAAALPLGRLVVLPEDAQHFEAMAAAIDEFLAEGEETGKKEELPSGTAIILFADIADSTALTEQMGDGAFRDRARDLDSEMRTIVRECSGTTVEGKLVGDGALAVFTSARQAIEAALGCGKAGDEAGLPLHLGLHAGDVIREGNNVYGGAVNIAARISAVSAPGEVLVSDTLRGLARTSAGVSFVDRGERTLRGVGEAVRLWAVSPLSSAWERD